MSSLREDKRAQLMAKGQSGEKEKNGQTRYQKRVKSKIASSNKEFNQIDMNKLFRDDILTVNIPVVGETNNYLVTFSFSGFLEKLHNEIETNGNVLALKTVLRAIVNSFNTDDVYIRCNCLHPDTEILLLDGTKCRIEDLCTRFNSGEQLYVYSTDDKGDFKPGVVRNVWKSGSSCELVKVTLDSGDIIQTTPDHRFMLRDGSYIAAKDLKESQSLMPMYFSECNGYQTVKFNSTGKYHSIYKQVALELLADKIAAAKIREATATKRGPYQVAIHHKDFNKHNNTPTNLEPLTWEEHWMYHASLGFNSLPQETQDKIRASASEWMQWLNAHPTEKMLELRKEFCERGRLMNYLPERQEQQRQVMSEAITNYWQTMSDEERERQSKARSERSKAAVARGCLKTEKFHTAALKRGEDMHTPEREKLIVEGIHRYWDSLDSEAREARAAICRKNIQKSIDARRGTPLTQEHKDRIRASRERETPEQLAVRVKRCNETKILKILNYLIDNKLELTLDNYNQIRKSEFKSYPSIDKRFDSIDDAVSYFQLNHKVAKVEFVHLNSPIDVYDIDVDTWHNFTTAAGVVLHNCEDFRYRFSYWGTRNNTITGEKELRPSDITNPDDRLGSGCKHIMLCLSNTGWCIKVAAVVKNYIEYMEKHLHSMYAKVIYPAIWQKPYEDPVQMSMFDDDDLLTDKDTIDRANVAARQKGRWEQGNQYRFTKQSDDKDQMKMTFDKTPEEEEDDQQ